MNLDTLLDNLPVVLRRGDGATDITDVTDDSRRATPGCLFIARAGTDADGNAFIADAVQRGAVAVLAQRQPADLPDHVASLNSPIVDQALAGRIAERFFGEPSKQLKVIGITGTNGKTTTAFLVRHLLSVAGVRCGMIGTIFNDDGSGEPVTAQLTTPGAVELSRTLDRMVANGCGAAVIEMSSHALQQGRVDALDIDVAVFTNLTGDHLDYHRDLDEYATAKARLFALLKPDAWAVLNVDSPHADRMLQDCRAHVLRCTMADAGDRDAECAARVTALAADFSEAILDGPWGSLSVKLPLVGRHNVTNALQSAAAATAVRTADRKHLRRGLETAPAVPGRLEPVRIDTEAKSPPRLPTVLVDYAHTHDALENVLLALRPLTKGKLIVVFGCGGDRDRTKRPKMAHVACKLADRVIITSDNPRNEDPLAIITQIRAGIPSEAAARVSTEPDRAAAIHDAVGMARDKDVVLIAGKGHEDYQILADRTIHFDDREQAARALQDRTANHRHSPSGAG